VRTGNAARVRDGTSARARAGTRGARPTRASAGFAHYGGTIDYFIDSTFECSTEREAYKYAAYDGPQRLLGGWLM
jgi:hypothetical protein